ncbi:MAG: DUF3575 domain-containing protein [Tannerellaceae bacterium]|jgi:hypothetical protein|nr:DUF3575 domain-containing protein [Tannerellaceae bacterium]
MNKIGLSFLCFALICFAADAQKIAVKNNVLYDAAGVANLGAEYAINKSFSVSLSANYNGWVIKQPMLWKHFLVQPEVRYWLREPFNEHFFGVQGTYGTYNVERLTIPGFERTSLYRNGTGFGGAISYGYHLYIAPRLSIEFSIAAGYLNLKYRKFVLGQHYETETSAPYRVDESTILKPGDANYPGFITRSYIGPTQIGISIVYIIK